MCMHPLIDRIYVYRSGGLLSVVKISLVFDMVVAYSYMNHVHPYTNRIPPYIKHVYPYMPVYKSNIPAYTRI